MVVTSQQIRADYKFLDTDEHRKIQIFFVFYLRTKSAFFCVLCVYDESGQRALK